MTILTINANKVAEDNLILKNWLEQESVFTENLTICRKRPTIVAVHDIRVAIKKLRSFLRLKDLFTNASWKDEFSKTAALFKSLGRLRDFDKSLHVVRKYEHNGSTSYPRFKEYLRENRKLVRKWVRKEAEEFNPQTDFFTDQLRSLSITDDQVIKKVIEETAQKIRKVKNLGRHVKKNAHEMRKQLKDVYFWVKICPENSINEVISVKALDKFLDDLGHWQDHFVLRRKLKPYRKETAIKEEKDQLKELEKKLTDEQDQILQKAKDKLQEV